MIRFLLLTRDRWAWQRQCDAGVLPVCAVPGSVSSQTHSSDLFFTTPPAQWIIRMATMAILDPQEHPAGRSFTQRQTIQNP
jgi:hypothetical protein